MINLLCRLLSASVLLGASALYSATPEPPPSSAPPTSAADRDWEALQDFQKTPGPKSIRDMTDSQRRLFFEWRALAHRARILDFLENHPTDPRRWALVQHLSPYTPAFIRGWTSDGKGELEPIPDEHAAAAWGARVKALKDAMALATDVPDSVREAIERDAPMLPVREALALAAHRETTANFAAARAALDNFAANYPDMPFGGMFMNQYLFMLERVFPAELNSELVHFAASPNQSMADTATLKQRSLAVMGKPLDLRFTAVDGRVVDIAKLQGKVVLIDFWATWCGPCIAELPNIKKVYADYHAKGFEIVGIALENGKLSASDTAEQTAAKLEAAKKILNNFTAKEDMPWPQYFDGKFWKNDLARRYGVGSIPAMFLIDQDGKVVSTNARGEKLEAEVKRLLKL